ncbi:MAG: hypothetical protein R3F20_05530 [Planctomycetota bacterium]
MDFEECFALFARMLSVRLTHDRIAPFCDRLRIPSPIAPEMGTKERRLRESLCRVEPSQRLDVARRLLDEVSFADQAQRRRVEDFVWSHDPCIEMPLRSRREIAEEFFFEPEWLDVDEFESLLRRLWCVDDESEGIFASGPSDLLRTIRRHVFRNREDWSGDYFFKKLGAYEGTSHRFVRFLEAIVSPVVCPNMLGQDTYVRRFNSVLEEWGGKLVEVDQDGGYPVFKLLDLGRVSRKPVRLLVFATKKKPHFRFRRVADIDLEVVSSSSDVLHYDRAIPASGLSWRDLQFWWSEETSAPLDQAKASLYRRLQDSIPKTSPPQMEFFRQFFKVFGDSVPSLPALLPEVWLHWDSRQQEHRRDEDLKYHRMDFLMLMPGFARVVLEVDGQQHYSGGGGAVSVGKYAAHMRADRDLRLDGYEVYRFGAKELWGDSAKVVEVFFRRLFEKHGVSP